MIGQLHTDLVNVYRTVSKDDGHGGAVEELRLVAEGIKCRLSQKTLGFTSNGELRSSTQAFKLFAAADVDIRQNDLLKVFRGKEIYSFLASKPFNYYNFIPHSEIALEQVVEE